MITVVNANALHIPLPDQSVQCVITSPPYWGLRDYDTAKWEGGSVECDHIAPQGGPSDKQESSAGTRQIQYRNVCAKCGATRIDAQIGLESTPAAYVANIVSVMRECWRVLKDDGVLWLNLGDSYAQNGGGYETTKHNQSGVGVRAFDNDGFKKGTRRTPDGLKPKDLCGIPWRVAFALQEDGWYLRSDTIEKVELYCPCGCGYILEEKIYRYSQDRDVIWHKPNPMPESVTDRPTKAHEYIFLLTKQARYYYDAEAIREPPTGRTDPMRFWKRGLEDNANGDRNDANRIYEKSGDIGRNRRSVWTVATSPYSGAHFATFPPALVEPMILAGSRRGDIVLDPFAGTATVGRICAKHGRQFIGTELNLKYIDLADERTSSIQQALL